MKRQLLLIPFFLLCACRTTAGTKESSNMPAPSQTQSEVLLQKIVGRLPEVPNKQFYDCKITSADVPDPAVVKDWIEKAKDLDLKTSMLFVAASTSIEIYAFRATEPRTITIFSYASNLQSRTPEPNSGPAQDPKYKPAQDLKDLANLKCPTPKQGL